MKAGDCTGELLHLLAAQGQEIDWILVPAIDPFQIGKRSRLISGTVFVYSSLHPGKIMSRCRPWRKRRRVLCLAKAR